MNNDKIKQSDVEQFRRQRQQANKNRSLLYENYAQSAYTPSNIENPYYDLPQTQEENSESIWQKGLNFAKSAINFATEDIPNALRMTAEKRARGFISEKQEQLRRLGEQDEALDKIEEYKDLVRKYYDPSTYSPEEREGMRKRIEELDEYFKSDEGRSNPVISALMYDYKDHDTSADNAMAIAHAYFKQDLQPYNEYHWTDLISRAKAIKDMIEGKDPTEAFKEGIFNSAQYKALGDLLTFGENALTATGNALQYSLNTAASAIDNALGTDYVGRMTNFALQNSNRGENYFTDKFIDDLYIGERIAYDNKYAKKGEEYDLWKNHNKRLEEEYNLELDQYIEDFNNGNLKIPFTELPVDSWKWLSSFFTRKYQYIENEGLSIPNAWDPEDVSEQWRRDQEQNAGSVLHPLYMVPEIGSTLGMIEGMLGTIGLNVAAEAVIRRLPDILVGGKKYKVALDAAEAMGDAGKYLSLIKKKNAIYGSKKLAGFESAIRAADIETGLGITTQQRIIETNQEAMEAVASRLQKNAFENGADANKVFSAILQYETEHGVDISRMEPNDLIAEAIARDIYTGDPVFEKAKKDSQVGIYKLINANNALAFHDYLETLPFLSYGEKILGFFGKTKVNNLADYIPSLERTNLSQLGGRRSMNQLWRDIAINRGEYKAISLAEQRQADFAQVLSNRMTAAYDGYIDGMAKKLINNKHLFKGLASKRVGEYVLDKAKTIPYTMAMEGFEEGIQTTISKRFERGEYDDYKKPYNQFSLQELSELPLMHGHVISAFLGLGDPAEDDEIVKSTIIGAFVGGLFPVFGSAVSNVSSNPTNQNLRNLLTQLKNDKVMTGLLSEHFNGIGDQNRINLFLNALHRTGVSSARLHRSLNDLKNSINGDVSLVIPGFVDDDSVLLDAASYMYNNEYIKEGLKKRGIEKYSQQHMDIMIRGAVEIADSIMSGKATSEAARNVMRLVDPNFELVTELLDENTTEERKQQIYEQNPELKINVEKFSKQYEKYLKDFEKDQVDARQSYEERKAAAIKKYQNESVDELLKHGSLKDFEEWKSKQGLDEPGSNALYIQGYRDNYIDFLIRKQFGDEYQEESPMKQDRYVKNHLTALSVYQQLLIARKMLNTVKNQKDRLEQTRLLTGLDLDTTMLAGEELGFEDLIKKLEAEEANLLESVNSYIDEENKSLPENQKKEHLTLSDIFIDDLEDLKFDNQSEIDKAFATMAMNHAVHFAKNRIASAYMDPKDIVPQELNEAIFGHDNGSTFLSKQVEAYKVKKATIAATPIEDKRSGQDEIDKEDLKQIAGDAAWSMIMENLSRKEKSRARIVRRRFEELSEGVQTDNTTENEEQEPVQKDTESNTSEESELEQALVSGQEIADKLDVQTGNLDPAEQKRRKKVDRMRQDRQKKQQKEGEKAEQKEQEKQEEKQSEQENNVPKTELTPKELEVKSTIDDAEQNSQNLPVPIINKYGDTPIIRIETLYTLADGQIIGKIEENGNTYYYVVVKADVEKDGQYYQTCSVNVHDQNGKLITEDQSFNATIPEGNNWNIDYLDNNSENSVQNNGFIPVINGISIQRTEQTNTPIHIEYINFGEVVASANIIGVEVIGGDNTMQEGSNTETDNKFDEDDYGDPENTPSEEDGDIEEAERQKKIEDAIYEQELAAEEEELEKKEELENALRKEEELEQEAQDLETDKLNATAPYSIGMDENGRIHIGGITLDIDLQNRVLEEAAMLEELERGLISQEDLPFEKHKKVDSQVKDEAYDYVSSVFFYRPSADEPMRLAINGKDIELKYQLGTGKQLAQRLIQKGWMQKQNESGKVYFVVTQAYDAARNKDKRTIEQDEDTFTVSIIIEDDENKLCYACSLRQLGKYTVSVKEKNPITGEVIEDESGDPIEKELEVDHERELRLKLARIHTKYPIGKTRSSAYEEERLNVAYNIYEDLYNDYRPQVASENAPENEREESLQKLYAWQDKVKEWLSYEHKMQMRGGETGEHFKQRIEERKNAIKEINEKARFNVRQNGKRPLTNQQIDENIEALRKVRSQIISAYLVKKDGKWVFPEKVRTDVRPSTIVISNGRFNNERTASTSNEEGDIGDPVLKNVTRENNPFGLKHDISEVNSQIQSGEIRLGIGSGELRSNNPNTINDFKEGNETQTYEGKGLAGKVFIITTSANGSQVPVMLSELKHNKQHTSSKIPSIIGNAADELQLCIDSATGEIVSTNGVKPSAAEVILYLLFGKLSKSQFIFNSEELQKQFATLFVNNGEDTLLNDSRIEAVLPYYAAKQLAVINGILYIGMPIGNGQYRQQKFAANDLFDDLNPQAKQNRINVIRAIASQMHWNTEKITMNEKFGGSMTNLIATELEKYFEIHPEENSFSVCDVKEFTFNKKDLFEVDSEGKPVRYKKNMTMAAWMLTTGKLLSSIGDTIFKDPFVFAQGVAEQKAVDLRRNAEEAGAVLETGDVDNTKLAAHNVLADQPKINRLMERLGAGVVKEMFHTEEDYINAFIELEKQKQSADVQKYGPPVRVLALDIPQFLKSNKHRVTEEQAEQYIKEKVQEIIDNIDPKIFGVEKLSQGEDTYDGVCNAYKSLATRAQKFMVTAKIFQDGHIKVYARNYVGAFAHPQKGSEYVVNGVYQSTKTGGKFDENAARKWLRETLGLSEHQVFVTDALLKGTENEKVFGVTNIAFDTILNETIGFMLLKRNAGRGIHFHEAFHYVNLLLHSPKQRVALYEEYVKTHKKLKNATYKEIEEAMAEDFRKYMELQTKSGLSGKIARFFSKIVDLLRVSRRKSQYRKVFESIRAGKYKTKVRLDRQAIKEFEKAYPQGVNMTYVPGLPAEVTANMPNITNQVDFYKVANGILDYIINESGINTAQDLINLSGKNFKNVIRSLKSKASELEPASAAMIQDFIDNPQALLFILRNRFQALGITTKIKRLDYKEDENPDEDATVKEDQPDNIFDRFQFTISKKDNIQLAAKMFLRQIPETMWVLNEDGTKSVDYVENELIPGIRKYTLYDVAYNKILEVCGKCTSYGVRDENDNYPPNSLRGLVKQAAKADSFFAALDEKLDDIEYDFSLQKQLYSAVNSQKPNIHFHEIQAAKEFKSFLSQEEIEDLSQEDIEQLQKTARLHSLADRQKQWVLQNDSTLQAARNIPRKWSGAAVLSGLVDMSKDVQTISEDFVKHLVDLKIEFNKIYETDIKKSTKDWNAAYIDLSEKAVEICNYFGIIMDTDVIDHFVNTKSSQNASMEDKCRILYDSFGKNTAGTFGYIISLLATNKGQTAIKYKIQSKEQSKSGEKTAFKEEKPIGKLFDGTKLSSDITKLALSYHSIHPSSSEFAVRGPNGQMYYPISQNNFQSAKLRNINTTAGEHAIQMMRSPYARHSIIYQTARNFEEVVPKEEQFTLNLDNGLKDSTNNEGVDFFGTTALEDYIQKMLLLDQDPEFVPLNVRDPKSYKNNEATHLTSPTMADKKTHYTISSKAPSFRTTHAGFLAVMPPNTFRSLAFEKFLDEMYPGLKDKFESLSMQERNNIIEEFAELNPEYKYRQLDEKTITRFAGYFLDELDTLEQYYNKKHIRFLVSHPNKLKQNYHGNIKGGRMDFSGNGGKFRYFYDMFISAENGRMNLNQKLQWLYNLEKDLLSGKSINLQNVSDDSLQENMSLQDIDPTLTRKSDFDGFELVRKELQKIRKMYFTKSGIPTNNFRKDLSKKIFRMLDVEMYKVCTDPRIKLGEWSDAQKCYIPTAVPAQLLSRQNARLNKSGIRGASTIYNPYMNVVTDAVAFYSLMTNHVINTFTSVIEFEKVFSSDPAFYKWKKSGSVPVSISYMLPSGNVVQTTETVENLYDKYSDKIKRAGSILSPGDEQCLDLSTQEQEENNSGKFKNPNSYHYTSLVVNDVTAKSKYLDSIIRPRFRNNVLAEFIRRSDLSEFPEIQKYIDSISLKNPEYSKERLISDIIDENRVRFQEESSDVSYKSAQAHFEEEFGDYFSDFEDYFFDFEDYFFDYEDVQDKSRKKLVDEYRKTHPTVSEYIFNLLPKAIRDEINAVVKQQSSPYEKINVADAQVFIRPILYRKIRKSLGLWDDERDEQAFEILETDADWQSDPVKAEIVRQFQAFAFKLSYVANESEKVTDGYYLNLGQLYKAAYFPVFKYASSSEIGRQIYDRMNRKGNEIDVICFESAVKVGAPKYRADLFSTESKNPVGKLSEMFDRNNDQVVHYEMYSEDGSDVQQFFGEDLLPIQILDLHYLRYQLNTKAHEASERGVGSQMAKLAFSNIIDDVDYGKNKSGQNPRKGSKIKQDVIACINALSKLGGQQLDHDYFFTRKAEDGTEEKLTHFGKVHRWMGEVARSNNLGTVVEELLTENVAESTISRQFMEQTVSSAVNKLVVDITTHGGTAVQQSMLGFNDYDGSKVLSDEQLLERNKTLSSSVEDIFDLTEKQKQYLSTQSIETVEDFVNSGIRMLKTKSIMQQMEYLNLHEGDKIIEGFHRINNGREIKWQAKENSMQVILSMNFFRDVIPEEYRTSYDTMRQYLIDNNIIGENSKPFGVGYRIPTQGMSSIFAFQVADVLPEQSGDLIIVPREFTAQTGSDFDVDKLFLATFAYEDDTSVNSEEKDGVVYKKRVRAEIKNKKEIADAKGLKHTINLYLKESKAAIQNQLLYDYIDVISDNANYAEARASIDTITNKIHDDLLSWLRPEERGYAEGMVELLPSFQSLRREEFKVGKDGIGPFALNTTNIALTQLCHLSLDYHAMGVDEYDFGHLDELDGQDGLRIAAWLSAMINAHVDVAKDPYVFTLNVNKATYNYANFLLRAGKGISTFTFLAQPILVDYASAVINSGGLYGNNLDGNNTTNKSFSQIKAEIVKELKRKYVEQIKQLKTAVPKSYWEAHKEELNKLNHIIAVTEYDLSSFKEQAKYRKEHDNKAPSFEFSRKSIFNYEIAKKHIINYRGGDKINQLKAAVYQLFVLESFHEIEDCAQAISDLVTNSQIDTKKFGNTITKQLNFENKLKEFIYNSKYPWIIRGTQKNPKVKDAYSTIALETYFNNSFLKEKFDAAQYYTRSILKGELLSAQDDFLQIFSSVAEHINGTLTYKVPAFIKLKMAGKKIPWFKVNKQGVKIRQFEDKRTFNPFKKEETVQTIADAVNNLMRFNILMNLSNRASIQEKEESKILQNDVPLLTGAVDETANVEQIQFVEDGDYIKTVRNIHRLFFGYGNLPSVPIRIKNLISEILSDPYGEKAEGLVEDGKIVNEFLLYLNPIAATKEVPIDRLGLNESAIRTSKDVKPLLTAYWNELLTHNNKEVRELARDLAVYAYYQTYDTNTANNLTDLIPPKFRSQYDKALKMAVRQTGGVKLKDVIGNFLGLGENFNDVVSSANIGELYLDIISRNYWYDDDIVPRITEHGSGKMDATKDSFEWRSLYATDSKSGQQFPGIIVSTNFSKKAPLYVKMVKKDATVLYRRVGGVSKVDGKGKVVSNKTAVVYLPIQKAGLHVGRTHIYEFFKTYFIPSMFQWNMLPGQYNHTTSLQHLKEAIIKWNGQLKDQRFVFNPTDQINIPSEYQSWYDEHVYKPVIKQKEKSLFEGSVEVLLIKDPKKQAQTMADIIIKFVKQIPKDYKDLPNARKTIYVETENADAISSIFEQLEALDMDPRAGRSIYFDADDDAFVLTDEEFDKYLNMVVDAEVEKYLESYANPSQQELDAFIDGVQKQYKDYAKQAGLLQKMGTAVNIVMQSLLTNEYSLQRVYAAGFSDMSRAALNAYYKNKEEFSTTSSYLYVSKDDYVSDEYDNDIQILQQEIETQDLYKEDSTLSEENQKLEQTEESVAEEIDDFIDSTSNNTLDDDEFSDDEIGDGFGDDEFSDDEISDDFGEDGDLSETPKSEQSDPIMTDVQTDVEEGKPLKENEC